MVYGSTLAASTGGFATLTKQGLAVSNASGLTSLAPAKHAVLEGRASRPSGPGAQVSQSEGQVLHVSLPLHVKSPQARAGPATPYTSTSASSSGPPGFCKHTFTRVTPGTSVKSRTFHAGIALGVAVYGAASTKPLFASYCTFQRS